MEIGEYEMKEAINYAAINLLLSHILLTLLLIIQLRKILKLRSYFCCW